MRTRRPDFNGSGNINRPYTGNTLRYNDRSFHVGHGSYQPAYHQHPGYRGYWGGNQAYGTRSNQGYGYGSNYGYGGGYATGWGYGNGNGSRFGVNSGGNSGLLGNLIVGLAGGQNMGLNGGYGASPLGWGLGGWGLGSMNYSSGYLGYTNPYYNNSYGTFGDYSYLQPIPVSYNASMAYASNDPNSADEVLNNAIAAFKQNDYNAALDITNQGIAQYPDDAVLHEFRALTLFAKQDYQQAAATIHSILAVGPGWDWATLSSMYPNVATYTEQLRALEAATKTNPQDAASRFLLAYHYLSTGHPDAAARSLQQVVKLMPSDRVASDVLMMVSAPQAGEAAPAPSQQPRQEAKGPAPKLVNPATLLGTWQADRTDGSKFSLTLTDQSTFNWSFSPKGQAAQTFAGTYSVEGNVLALERKDGGSLIAEVISGGDAKFNFKLLGAPSDDPGLDFSK